MNLVFEADGARLGLVVLEPGSKLEGEVEGTSGIDRNFFGRQQVAGEKTGSRLKSSVRHEIDSCSCWREALCVGPTAAAVVDRYAGDDYPVREGNSVGPLRWNALKDCA